MVVRRCVEILLAVTLVLGIVFSGCAKAPPTPAPAPAPAPTPAPAPKKTIVIGGTPAEWVTSRIKGSLVADVIARKTPYNTKIIGGLGLTSRERFGPLMDGEIDLTLDIGGMWTVYLGLGAVAPDLAERLEYLFLFPNDWQVIQLVVYKEFPFNSLRGAIDSKQPLKIGTGRFASYAQIDKIWEAMGAPDGVDSVVKYGGMIEKSTNPGRLYTLLREGELNAYMALGPTHYAELEGVNSVRPLKVCAVVKDEKDLPRVIDALSIKGAVNVGRYVMKAGHYTFVTEDTPMLANLRCYIASPKMSDEVAYNIAKAIWDEREFLSSAHTQFAGCLKPEMVKMAKEMGLPFHPGAERFYREAGLL